MCKADPTIICIHANVLLAKNIDSWHVLKSNKNGLVRFEYVFFVFCFVCFSGSAGNHGRGSGWPFPFGHPLSSHYWWIPLAMPAYMLELATPQRCPKRGSKNRPAKIIYWKFNKVEYLQLIVHHSVASSEITNTSGRLCKRWTPANVKGKNKSALHLRDGHLTNAT